MLSCVLAWGMTSCSFTHREELKHIEQLEEKLLANHSNLAIDEKLFQDRAVYIDSVLMAFKNNYKDTISLELGNQLSRFKSIRKNYTHQVKQFMKHTTEQKELEDQLKALRTDVKKGRMSKNEFKNHFSIEKMDVEALISESELAKKTLYELEPEYSRLVQEISTQLATMK
jgi:septal ring factor EnvC (AmiA/AmiB activator)